MAGLALLGAARAADPMWREIRRLGAPANDGVGEHDRAWTPARPLLTGVRVVGYAADLPNTTLMRIGYGDQTLRYFLAQYSLAPTRIDFTVVHDQMIADFRTGEAMNAYAAEHGYAIRWHDGGRALLEAR